MFSGVLQTLSAISFPAFLKASRSRQNVLPGRSLIFYHNVYIPILFIGLFLGKGVVSWFVLRKSCTISRRSVIGGGVYPFVPLP